MLEKLTSTERKLNYKIKWKRFFILQKNKKYTYNIEAGGDKKRHPKAIIEKEMNLYRHIDA